LHASASEFLRSRSEELTREIVERTLLSELAMDSARLHKFEAELQPMFVALPKNEDGNLESTGVRYALHRYFVQKHGWYVKGLAPSGQAWNSSAPTSVMKSRVPVYIHSLFEERMHGQGMGLHDLAVFAATLEDFVHNEALADIVELFSSFSLPTTSPISGVDAERIIKAYVLQILDGNLTISSGNDLRDTEYTMKQDFPSWSDFMMWVQDVREMLSMERSRRSMKLPQHTLDSVIEEAQELNDRLGAYQDIECRSLKAGLADIDFTNTGRVALSDFYKAGLNGKLLYVEHAKYLRRVGALDESDPHHPSVIIANFLVGPANCLASTSFHSVCCFNECENLLGHVERAIAAPRASSGQISQLVSGLRSDTVDAPRNLSASLLSRLEEIADHHDGLVPLHGRLFAQWMHHAYPLECPYPHVAGSTTPLTPDEWLDESGEDDIAASIEERLRIINGTAAKPAKVDVLPWTAVEELVVHHRSAYADEKGSHTARKLAAFAAVMAMAVSIIRASAAYTRPGQEKCEKHLV